MKRKDITEAEYISRHKQMSAPTLGQSLAVGFGLGMLAGITLSWIVWGLS